MPDRCAHCKSQPAIGQIFGTASGLHAERLCEECGREAWGTAFSISSRSQWNLAHVLRWVLSYWERGQELPLGQILNPYALNRSIFERSIIQAAMENRLMKQVEVTQEYSDFDAENKTLARKAPGFFTVQERISTERAAALITRQVERALATLDQGDKVRVVVRVEGK